ncbi:hypothetical protein F4782DRAFT_495524 [Xylaria castorea]|nr:hypothetical protein F4782DRAFT_495524 [Xylaria castorea]
MSIPTPSSAVFHLFDRMPPEMCDMIWDTALLAEAKNRMVFADEQTRAIYPTRLLISPFMKVCHASRGRAQRIYNYRESVYRVKARDTLPSVTGPNFYEFKLGKEVGVVYLSPRYDTFCPGFSWPPVGLGPTCFCMRGVSYCSTKSLTPENPLLLSVWKVCSFVGYRLNRSEGWYFMGEGTPDSPLPSNPINFYVAMFPNIQYWFAIFYPDQQDMYLPAEIQTWVMTTDVQVIADKGWEGQRQLMNMLPFKYRISTIKGNPPFISLIPLSDLDQIIDA